MAAATLLGVWIPAVVARGAENDEREDNARKAAVGTVDSNREAGEPRDPEEPLKAATPGEGADTPTRVTLPPAGLWKATDILPLAAALSGRDVRLEDQRIAASEVRIPVALGEKEVGLEEMSLLLRGAQIYLFEVEDPAEGRILVATSNPQWKPEAKPYHRVIEPSAADFDWVSVEVRKIVDEQNAKLPEGEERMVAVDAWRAGKILVSSPRKEDVEAIDKALASYLKRDDDKDRPRLFTYLGRFRRVEELKEELLADLQEGERNQLRIVVAFGGKGNRLLYRCPAELGGKVKGILEKHDVPPKKRPSKGASDKGSGADSEPEASTPPPPAKGQ